MDSIKEIYIEPTSRCNLNCAMCMRKQWRNETENDMDIHLFNKLMDELPDSITRVFFCGVGEPLCHPEIITMIRRAKQSGRTVEMITNGTLLDSNMSKNIINAGLDKLWISLDSLDAECYESIRVGAELSGVLKNIDEFNRQRDWTCRNYHVPDKKKIKLGIAFVLQKNNLSEYKALLDNAHTFGLESIKATHLLPYNESQQDQICYRRMLGVKLYNKPISYQVKTDMPIMETEDILRHNLISALESFRLTFSFMDTPYHRRQDYCRFVQEGITYVRFDGEVSPCMALIHNNTIYQQDTERQIRHCSFGSIRDQCLTDIWNGKEYSSFRRRVTAFDFSPCTQCASCELFEDNETDCFGSPFPTCGGCLWAQGFIQCP